MGFRRALAEIAAAATATTFVPAQAATTRAPNPAVNPVGWITVAHPPGRRPVFVDQRGREVLLRGANVVGIEDDYYDGATTKPTDTTPQWPVDPAAYAGSCPAMNHRSAEPPICEVDAGGPEFAQSAAANSRNDLAQLRALGMNVMRLTLSWSELEPTPGAYSTAYLDRIAQVVGWAAQQNVRVLLDMHQDNYSRYTPGTAPLDASPLAGPTPPSANHADGAPPWAVITDGEPAIALAGQAPFNAYVAASFDSFWHNRIPTGAPTGAAPGPGLQDHYIGALAALGKRFAANPTVVGYEIMNEPLSGTAPPVMFSTAELFPFYRRVIDALTGARDGLPCPTGLPPNPACGYPDLGVHVRHQSFFFEPMVLRDVTDGPDQVPSRFSSYPNLVYAPHVYTHEFTADAIVGIPPGQSPYPTSYDQAYTVADREARVFGAALWVGEFGNSARDDPTILAGTTAAADRALTGNAIWDWKSQCGAGTTPADCLNAWSVYAGDPSPKPAQNGPLVPSRVLYLSRPYPMLTAGRLDALGYDPARRRFTMAATASRARRGADTVIWLPPSMAGNVTVTGAAVLSSLNVQPDGSRLVVVAPTRRGPYLVTAS